MLVPLLLDLAAPGDVFHTTMNQILAALRARQGVRLDREPRLVTHLRELRTDPLKLDFRKDVRIVLVLDVTHVTGNRLVTGRTVHLRRHFVEKLRPPEAFAPAPAGFDHERRELGIVVAL